MKAFITVMGHDTVGVVAKVSGLCSELNIIYGFEPDLM